jgi:hypothetical protein
MEILPEERSGRWHVCRRWGQVWESVYIDDAKDFVTGIRYETWEDLVDHAARQSWRGQGDPLAVYGLPYGDYRHVKVVSPRGEVQVFSLTLFLSPQLPCLSRRTTMTTDERDFVIAWEQRLADLARNCDFRRLSGRRRFHTLVEGAMTTIADDESKRFLAQYLAERSNSQSIAPYLPSEGGLSAAWVVADAYITIHQPREGLTATRRQQICEFRVNAQRLMDDGTKDHTALRASIQGFLDITNELLDEIDALEE